MTKTTIISLFSFLLLLSNNSFSQDIGTIDLSNLKQEVVTNHDFPGGRFLDKPILEMSYGISDISLNGLNEKINNAGMSSLNSVILLKAIADTVRVYLNTETGTHS